MITQKLLNELFVYENGKLFWKQLVKNNTRSKIGDEAGYISSTGYLRLSINRKMYKVHRLIYLMKHGVMPEFIDHIDGNRLNNNIENLREATKSQNQHNKNLQSNNTSGIKGVSLHKASGKWRAVINEKHLGLFDSKNEAIVKIQHERKKLHGNFANNG